MRPSCSQATRVVPVPRKGSRTVAVGGEHISTKCATTGRGKTAPWTDASCPLAIACSYTLEKVPREKFAVGILRVGCASSDRNHTNSNADVITPSAIAGGGLLLTHTAISIVWSAYSPSSRRSATLLPASICTLTRTHVDTCIEFVMKDRIKSGQSSELSASSLYADFAPFRAPFRIPTDLPRL